MIEGNDIWHPTPNFREDSNLASLIGKLGLKDYGAFLRLSVDSPERYWDATLEHMGIVFDPRAEAFLDSSAGPAWPRFFPGAGFNFAEACIRPPVGSAAGEEPAILWENEAGESGAVSYAMLRLRTRRFAAGLLRLGVKPGDRVALLFANRPEAVIALLAIGYIGAISVPLYSGYGADAVATRLGDSGARFLIASEGFHRRGKYVSLRAVAVEALKAVPHPVELILDGGDDDPPADDVATHHRWRDVEQHEDAVEPARTLAEDPYMIIYTSGTTGRPKGALHVHGGFPLRVAQDSAFHFDFKAGDRYFWFSDMGWMVGPFSICSALLLKGALVLYDGAPNVPDIGRLRAVAAHQGVTHFGSTPTAIRAMAAAEEVVLKHAAPSLRVLMTGGEVVDGEAFAWFYHAFGGSRLPIINYTGGTEVSGALLSNSVLRPIEPCRFNTKAPGVAVEIVDAGGVPVRGAVGELAVVRPFIGMTRGFWNDDARYLESYWSRIPGMWVHGDLAIEEGDGQYLLLGRSDDVMKVSGKRVGPSEVEGMITDGHVVAEAVVFSVPDPKIGEAMIVFVVAGPDGQAMDAAAIERWVGDALRTKMGPSFKASAVVVLPELAKTKNGKLVRRLARQAWLNEPAGDLSAIERPAVFSEIAAFCQRFHASHRTAPRARASA